MEVKLGQLPPGLRAEGSQPSDLAVASSRHPCPVASARRRPRALRATIIEDLPEALSGPLARRGAPRPLEKMLSLLLGTPSDPPKDERVLASALAKITECSAPLAIAAREGANCATPCRGPNVLVYSPQQSLPPNRIRKWQSIKKIDDGLVLAMSRRTG